MLDKRWPYVALAVAMNWVFGYLISVALYVKVNVPGNAKWTCELILY